MFSHYLSIAIRQLVKNRLYTVISIAGLGAGLASVFLIFQYVTQETSFDRFHADGENIYRITWHDENPQTRTPHPMALAMVHDFPEVENGTTLTPLFGPGMIRRTFSIRNLDKNIRFDESNVMAVDTTFFKVFTFPLVKGNPLTALKDPGAILISESMAKKYFGSEDPIGKKLAVNDEQRFVEVAGVFKDVPPNSHFHFDILVSYLRLKADDPSDTWFSWNDFGHYNYVKLRPGADAKALESRLFDWAGKHINLLTPDQVNMLRSSGYTFRLQPIRDIHLHSNLHWELESNGNINYVYMLTAAATLILVIACLNFINLTTAQSVERAKEIGIRKSLGAIRKQLSGQFIGESLLIAWLGALVALLLIEGAVPFYNAMSDLQLVIKYIDLIILLGGAATLCGLLAGLYPAAILSMIQPGSILKGKFLQSPKGTIFRTSFITFQFFASMVLISSSLIIYSQLTFLNNKGLGFDKEELIVLPIKNRSSIVPRFQALQTELLRVPGVVTVTGTSNVPGRNFNQNPVFPANAPDVRVNASEVFVDYDFFKTLGIAIKDGRLFSHDNPRDSDTFIINETAAKNLYPDGAVGKELVWEDEDGPQRRTIIGVIKDFNFQSLHDPIRPLLFIPDVHYNYVLMKVSTADFERTIAGVEQTWKKFDNQFDFGFSFLSDNLNQQYTREQNMGKAMLFFSVLAVIITCIGLLGIAALTFRQKTKEVSIRKVLGATVGGIAWMLLKSFTILVLIAIVLAIPFIWWLMNGWLSNFNFRIEISPLIFVSAGVLLIAVTWATLSYLTLRIAKVNPAETLKSE